ncbi:unnamed protein product [Alopecurus aequalis]
MGATASRGCSSPSLPTMYSLMETRSTTRLFTVPDYSKCVLRSTGSALLFEKLHVLDRSFVLEVYPTGLNRDAADSIAAFVVPTIPYWYKDTFGILIEILHGSGEEHTVFDNHTAGSSQTTRLPSGAKGYHRFVKRKELEASGCVRNDSFTIRCTVSIDVRVARSPAEVTEAMSVDVSSSKPVVSGSHTLAIGSFSKFKAALRAGECVHSTQFSIGGSSWYFKVYPNGHCEDNKNASIFLGRGRSHGPATTAEFCFEIASVKEEELSPFTECTFDDDNPEHEFPYIVICSFPATDGDDDRLVVRCNLRVINVTTPSLLPTEADDQPV